MAVLPENSTGLTANTAAASQPTRTWYCNQSTGRIQGEIDGYAATKQAVEIILNTERYRWGIYRSSSGVEYDGLIGMDPGFVFLEFQRRVKDALRMDDRITGADSFAYTFRDGNLSVTFTVHTVYGDITETAEVTIS